MAVRPDPIALELFKNHLSIADEMALMVFRTTYSAAKDNMDY
jgi:hypothetical protein